MSHEWSAEKHAVGHEPEGLEVVQPPSYLERAAQDSEGLQFHQAHPTEQQDAFPEVYGVGSKGNGDEAVPLNPASKAPAPLTWRQNRRRWLISGLAVLAVIVILAIVLGGVLGARAGQSSASPSPAMQAPASSATTPTARVKSTVGAWNGTGISSWTDTSGMSGNLCFQDFTSAVICLTFTYNNATNTLSLASGVPSRLDITPSNNTALKTAVWMNQLPWIFQTFYVDSTGHWADVTQTVLNGGISRGNLSSLGIEAPTDYRPALAMITDRWDGPTKGSNGGRLFVGAANGHVNQYSYDQGVGSWYPNSTYTFSDAYAYGPAWSSDINNADGSYWRTLLLSDQTGALKSYAQQGGLGGETGWPTGAQWTVAKDLGEKASVNSSLLSIVDWDGDGDGYVWYPPADAGVINSQHTNLNRSSPANAQNNGFLDVSLAGDRKLPIMQGSDMASAGLHASRSGNMDWNWTLVFYQDEGSSIAFAVVARDGKTVLTTGHVVFNDGSWQVVQ